MINSALPELVQMLVDRNSLRLAVAGNVDGSLEVEDRPNFIHARLGATDGDPCQVRTGRIRPNWGDVVFVQLENPALGLGPMRLVFWLRDGNDPTLGPPIIGTGRVRCRIYVDRGGGKAYLKSSRDAYLVVYCE